MDQHKIETKTNIKSICYNVQTVSLFEHQLMKYKLNGYMAQVQIERENQRSSNI